MAQAPSQSLWDVMFGKGRGDNAVEEEKKRLKKLEDERDEQARKAKKKLGAAASDLGLT